MKQLNPILEKLLSLPPETALTASHVAAIVQSLTTQELDYEKLPGSKMIDEQALADWLGEPTSNIQKWRVKGSGPKFVKLPKAIRYEVKAVRDWIQGKTVSSTTEATIKGISRMELAFPVMHYADGHQEEFFESIEQEAEPTSYSFINIAGFFVSENHWARYEAMAKGKNTQTTTDLEIDQWFMSICVRNGFCKQSTQELLSVFNSYVAGGGDINHENIYPLSELLIDEGATELSQLTKLKDCPEKHTALLFELFELGLDPDIIIKENKTAREIAFPDSLFIEVLNRFESKNNLEALLPSKNEATTTTKL